MKIVLLDAKTLGDNLDFNQLSEFGEVKTYPLTAPQQVAERLCGCDVVIVNKIKLNSLNLEKANTLKLICLFATGYDNVDTDYCNKHGIAVCNVKGYSTMSVAQVTVAIALSLICRLQEYGSFVSTGKYTAAGLPNRLEPGFFELLNKTWGIVGYGEIGGAVAKIAQSLGCSVLITTRTPVKDIPCVDIEELLKSSDIVSLHVPLSELSRGLISRDRLSIMKKGAILINTSRGAVTDEEAVTEAVLSGRLGAFGADVYSTEPFGVDHPFNKIMHLPNVCLTPHMAWAATEARQRCLWEIVLNIRSFLTGGQRNRIV